MASAEPPPQAPPAEPAPGSEPGPQPGQGPQPGAPPRRKPARKRRRGRSLRVLAWLIAAAVVAVLAGLGWLLMGYPQQPGAGRGRVVEIALRPGMPVREVAQQLAHAGAVRDPRLFELYARVRGAQARLHVGSVLVYDNMRPEALLQRVASGYGSAQLRVVIPEGFSRFDIAARLARWGVCERAAFIAASQDPALLHELAIDGESAEGWLFPDTYLLREEIEPRVLLRRFVANARRRFSPLFERHAAELSRLREELGFGVQQVVTLASIVEKEARAKSEQATIAGVFYNRLRDPSFRPKRLQADPTVAYGCLLQPELASCAPEDGKPITHAMLLDSANRYNTYRHDGLPPGPIANPGVAAVEATLVPEAHDYYYFVASGGGHHRFSATLAAHNAAIQAAHSP